MKNAIVETMAFFV